MNIDDHNAYKLCFIQKWNPQIHGFENDDLEYINYLKTKKIVLDSNSQLDSCNEYINEIMGIIRNDDNSQFSVEDCEVVIAKKFYLYRDRMFIIENNGINIFKKLWKNYHYNYIIPRKQLKNIFKREIYGKFII